MTLFCATRCGSRTRFQAQRGRASSTLTSSSAFARSASSASPSSSKKGVAEPRAACSDARSSLAARLVARALATPDRDRGAEHVLRHVVPRDHAQECARPRGVDRREPRGAEGFALVRRLRAHRHRRRPDRPRHPRALIDLGARSAIARPHCAAPGAQRRGGKRRRVRGGDSARWAAHRDEAADSVGSSREQFEGGGHDETAGGGGATVDLQDDEAASGAMPSARKFVTINTIDTTNTINTEHDECDLRDRNRSTHGGRVCGDTIRVSR